MVAPFIIADLARVLPLRQLSTMVGWNRLEGRPRTRDFQEALRAEVRDPLWLLTRQWQMGEFKGDDAGSPIAAAPVIERAQFSRYQSGTAPASMFDLDVPPEARVEARPLVFTRAGQPMALDLRLQMGRYWLRLIRDIGDFTKQYTLLYGISKPDKEDRQQVSQCAHVEVWQSYAAAAGRLMDGYAFYLHLSSAGGRASVGISAAAEALTKIDDQADQFLAWFKRQYVEPESATSDAWFPERLEYRFQVAASAQTGEKVLSAEEYSDGHLDWYNFDVDSQAEPLGVVDSPTLEATALLPMPATFPGMPDTRWWAFEDGKINLGKADVNKTDLGKMLFLDFGFLYANDWYLMPLTIPSGSICTIKGIAVTNVFGERFWVAPAGEGIDDDWQRWTMFTLSKKGKKREIADTGLMAAPVIPKIQEGKALDEVLLLRDEMANMVWGIERTVPLPDGRSMHGLEAARDVRGYFERRVGEGVLGIPPVANLRYDVMSSVAENWIPFIPAKEDGSTRQIKLQRGSMLRLIEADPDKPRRITPRTATLREGLEESTPQAYFIKEEEVPRAGVIVSRAFQRTRWHYGRTFVWIGMRKEVGRAEGASGLEFDRLVHMKTEQ